jgi:regulator of nucleoside diphosphate kinase
MNKKTIELHITAPDRTRLERLLKTQHSRFHEEKKHLATLRKRLDDSIEVSPEDIPEDVVAVESEVHVEDLGSKRDRVYTLAFPESADIGENRVSLLAPISVALLGRRVGEVVTCDGPGGARKLKIKGILSQLKDRRS